MTTASRGADLFVDTLIRLGSKHAFNILGIGMLGLGESFHARRADISYISAFNETDLALMAQGYARELRRPTVACVYHSSGTALAMMALTVAWGDHIPLVLVSTTSSRRSSGRDQYAAVPRSILEMGAQYAKWSFEVPTVDRIPEALARAYAIAGQAPMGPVHLAIPGDLYDEEWRGPLPRANFADTQRFEKTCADAAGLHAAAAALAAAVSPVVMVGAEVGQYHAVAEMVAVIEALGAPAVVAEQPPYLGLPMNHPQFAGTYRANSALLAGADVVLAVGVEFTELGIGEPPLLNPTTQVIALSVDSVLPVKQLWPKIALSGHPVPSLAHLAERLRSERIPAERIEQRLRRCGALRAARRAEAERIRATRGPDTPVPPSRTIDEVREFCGDAWHIIQAGVTATENMDLFYEIGNPYLLHSISGKASAQGWGAPTAVGVQLASPERRVLAFLGDGGFMFCPTAIYLAARLHLPMIFIVFNNGGWGCVKASFQGLPCGAGLDEMGWMFGQVPIDFAGFARSLGLKAERAHTGEQVGELLRKAGAGRDPWLIEVLTA